MRTRALVVVAALVMGVLPVKAFAAPEICGSNEEKWGVETKHGGQHACLHIGGSKFGGKSEYLADDVATAWPVIHFNYSDFF